MEHDRQLFVHTFTDTPAARQYSPMNWALLAGQVTQSLTTMVPLPQVSLAFRLVVEEKEEGDSVAVALGAKDNGGVEVDHTHTILGDNRNNPKQLASPSHNLNHNP